jgi:hypothetical protein
MIPENEIRNAARRAIAKKMKSRFFHRWNRPGYETMDQFLAHVRATLSPAWLPDLGSTDYPDGVLVSEIVVRTARNDLAVLLSLVDDCLCYIAHLEERMADAETGPE